MRLIFLGAPGAGKGTQAEITSKRLNIPAISTGNIIRESLKNGTELGLKAKSYIESGGLVPDSVVIEIIKERLSQPDCKSGFILDGFPRTVAQAQALEEMCVIIDKVVSIEVADESIKNRLSGRRICGECARSYHITDKPSLKEGICDTCGGELIIRNDDKPETIAERLAVYHELTEPLKDYYRAKGLVVEVQGQEDLADTTRLVSQALEA